MCEDGTMKMAERRYKSHFISLSANPKGTAKIPPFPNTTGIFLVYILSPLQNINKSESKKLIFGSKFKLNTFTFID
jgi:hypothetical protein